MSEIFIIKDTGKGVINELPPEKVVPIQSPQGGGTTGDYIPLTGTEEGKPITGGMEFSVSSYEPILSGGFKEEDVTTAIIYANKLPTSWTDPFVANSVQIDEVNKTAEIVQSILYVTDESSESMGDMATGFQLSIGNSERRKFKQYGSDADTYISNGLGVLMIGSEYYGAENGIIGRSDFRDYYVPNSFVQKAYVDQANSYSTTETKTGGTWIDGKPIYTITQLTANAIPADMETRFPDEIIGDYTFYKYTKTTDPTP